MASNQTAEYGFNQWSLTDSVRMEDFNADNQKMEQALQQVAAAIPHVYTGSYTGTGEYGAEHPNILTFDFTPKLVIVRTADMYMHDLGGNSLLIWVQGAPEDSVDNRGTTRHFSLNETSLSWYVDGSYASAAWQMNNPGVYHYVAIG